MQEIGGIVGALIAGVIFIVVFMKVYDSRNDIVQNLFNAIVVTGIILVPLYFAFVFLTDHWFISAIVTGLIVGSIKGKETGIGAGILAAIILFAGGYAIPNKHHYTVSQQEIREQQERLKKQKNKKEEEEEEETEEEIPAENIKEIQKENVKEIAEESKNAPAKKIIPGLTDPPGIHWIKSENNGAYIWNPSPVDGEKIEWSGDYIQDGEYRFAEGYGKVTWYRYGKVVQIDEGNWVRGQRNGKIKQQFISSGKVEYNEWINGRIPAPANTITDSDIFVGNSSFTGWNCYIMADTVKPSAQSTQIFFLKLKMISRNGELHYLDYTFNLDGNFETNEGFKSKADEIKTPIEWNILQVLKK